MAHTLRIGAMAGLLASVSMTITPANAAEMPSELGSAKHNALYTQFDVPLPGDSLNEGAEWGRWGGWGRRGWRRGRRGIRAGDVLAGVAIIGGIAAIASAANNNNDRRDRRRQRTEDWERENQQDRELRDLREQNREQQRELEYLRGRGVSVETYRGRGGQERLPQSQAPLNRAQSAAPISIDGAIDTCSNAASRDAQVADIDGVERAGESWNVRGRIDGGEGFTCRISNDGQIEALNYSDGFRSSQNEQGYAGSYSSRAEAQLSDDRYANARVALAQRSDPREPLNQRYSQGANEPQPAYPGGPIPGETIPDTIDGDTERSWRN